VFAPQVLEAVGRKDLRAAAPVLDRDAPADSGRGNAAVASVQPPFDLDRLWFAKTPAPARMRDVAS
jgi:hypothetical protein